MKTPQNIQPSLDDEISIADKIHFFKSHKKIILIFVIIGSLLGGIIGNFIGPVYKGTLFILPAKISGAFAEDPGLTVTKLRMNAYYSKELLVKCNPQFYKDEKDEKDEDDTSDYELSSIVKGSVTKDSSLIQIFMQNKNKTVIKDCLTSMLDHIRTSQNKIIDPIIQSKNIDLRLAEESLKSSEEFTRKLNDKQIKELKTNDMRFAVDLLYTNIILSNSNNVKASLAEIRRIKFSLAPEQTKFADKFLPINVQKKSFPTPKLCALIGLFLGLCLGILIALIKRMKI